MNKRYEIIRYAPYNVTGMKYHLEKMAKKGWMIDHITNNYWCYRKSEPADHIFTVSYFTKASAYEAEKSEGQETFEEMAAKDGWKLIAENAKLQIYTNHNKEATPIYTDAESEVNSIIKASRSFICLAMVLITIVLLNFYHVYRRFQRDPLSALADNSQQFICLGLMILLIYMLNTVIRYFIWKHQAMRGVENEEFIETAKSDFSLQNWVTVIAMMICLSGAISSGNKQMAIIMLTVFFGLFFIYFIVDAFRILLKKKKTEKNVNLFFTMLVDILLALALSAGISFILSTELNTSYNKNKAMITMADYIDGESSHMITNYDESLWIRYNEAYTASIGKEHLRYRMIDVKNEKLKDFILQQMLKGDTDYMQDHDYKETDPALFNADLAYQLQSGDQKTENYLIQYGNRFVEIEFSWKPDAEDREITAKAFR